MSAQLLAIVIEAAIRATLLAMLVGILLWLLKIPRGAPRHTAWLIVVIAMILMPALQRLTPALPALISPRVPDFAGLMPLTVPAAQPVTASVAPAADPTSTGRLGPEPLRFAPSPSDQPASVSSISWLQVAASVYALIAIGLLLRVILALGTVRAIYRRARPIGNGLFESPSIATPVTIGLARPRIVLPTAWTDWPESTRLAVVAHERAHAMRRDPLVALLTRLNSCVFWFHPLAWRLERTLADASEQACDEVGVQAVPHPRQYAEVLLAMTAASQRAGGRIVWAGVSVEGRGRMSARIDRILLGRPATSMSHTQKLLVAAGCVVAVTAAVACRPSQPPPPPLVADETPRPVEHFTEVRDAAGAMTWEQAAELQAQWRRNPEDLAAVEKLLFFYQPVYGRHPPADDSKKIAGRRPLILWLIEHHPDSPLIQRLPTGISPSGSGLPDPRGYEAAKRLWLAHASRPDVSPATLRNAAWRLQAFDKAVAEQLLLQGQRKYPGTNWSQNLGRLYAQAILGPNRFTLGNGTDSTSPVVADDAFATKARETLEASTDPVLLEEAGNSLISFGRTAAGRSYLERAKQLDPKSQAGVTLALVELSEQHEKARQLLSGVPRESMPQRIAALPETQRLAILAREAANEYKSAESLDESGKAARAAWQRSKKYAQDAVDLAHRLPNHPYSPDALFAANVALGANAFREGDRSTAVRYMLSAADAPPSSIRSPALKYGSLEERLIGPLLHDGERETVIRYFERSAENRPRDRERLLAAATAIRNGKLPSNYERR
jgi:beta-lactamase regulating signal transducer with metallopeptidase domain